MLGHTSTLGKKSKRKRSSLGIRDRTSVERRARWTSSPLSMVLSIAGLRSAKARKKKDFCLEPCHRVPTAELKARLKAESLFAFFCVPKTLCRCWRQQGSRRFPLFPCLIIFLHSVFSETNFGRSVISFASLRYVRLATNISFLYIFITIQF